jgi:hypothetical protein
MNMPRSSGTKLRKTEIPQAEKEKERLRNRDIRTFVTTIRYERNGLIREPEVRSDAARDDVESRW